MCSGIKKIIAGEWVSRYYAKLLSMMRYSVCMVHLPSSNLFCSSRHAKQCGIGVFFFAVIHTLIFARDAMLTRVLAMALCLCLSVTSRCFVKTDERIELVFGETASQCQIFYYEKLMCMPTKLDGTSSGEGDCMGRRMSGNQGWKTLVLTNVLVFKFKKVLNICKFFGFLNFMFCKALLGVAYLRCRHFVN